MQDCYLEDNCQYSDAYSLYERSDEHKKIVDDYEEAGDTLAHIIAHFSGRKVICADDLENHFDFLCDKLNVRMEGFIMEPFKNYLEERKVV